jgi:phytoene synthase
LTTHNQTSQHRNTRKTKQADPDSGATTEWIERAIPAGSSRYYAMLHASDEDRPRLQTITALIGIWSQLAFNSNETDIALRKIEWWREELNGTHQQHPLSVQLQQLPAAPQQASRLQEILSGYAELLQFGSPSTDEANKLFHWNTGAIACLALTGAENTHDNPVARTGVVLSRFRCLRHLPEHINSKLLCLPMTVLEANNISPAQLQPGSGDPVVQTFLQQQLQAIENEMDRTADTLLHAGATTRPLYIYLRSQQRLAAKLIKRRASLLQPVTPLSPIRNYFIAFNAARQHYRYNHS